MILGVGSCSNPGDTNTTGFLPGQAGCHLFRLSAQVYLEKADFVKLGHLVVELLTTMHISDGSYHCLVAHPHT